MHARIFTTDQRAPVAEQQEAEDLTWERHTVCLMGTGELEQKTQKLNTPRWQGTRLSPLYVVITVLVLISEQLYPLSPSSTPPPVYPLEVPLSVSFTSLLS